MARNRDGHADLDDLHDRLGSLHSRNAEIGGRLDLTNALLQAIARQLGAKVPVAILLVRCDNRRPDLEAYRGCYHSERVVLHEGDAIPEQCRKCKGPVRIDND